MKIVGFRLTGDVGVTVGRLDDDSVQPITDLKTFWTNPRAWTAKAHDVTDVRLPLNSVQLVPPVPESARVVCIGLNYREHAAEGSFNVPDYPTLFGRWTSSLTAGGVSAPVPADEAGLDWEGEVAAYVGSTLCDVDADTARAAVLGYSTFNDLTARKAQKLTAQWTLGKNGDRTGPMGPLVTSDEVGDLRDGLRVMTRVNGSIVQDGNTRDHIFELGDVLSLISRTLTLNPGDVIATGTPAGVGYVRNPPWLLNDGDTVEVEIDRLGTLVTPIVGSSAR
ncbi:fumarylacetoacetate hydrolase family protein [Rhodococcoides fascians]|uniref:fumarylacetoacetate hydrolase family protein n=1 Tax=Rhodococcoides fascians TaxID=1828 RepID=UPI00050CC45E|nr:fumarylacetoacetate hydrolase family protein [Rhodococcus fascians]